MCVQSHRLYTLKLRLCPQVRLTTPQRKEQIIMLKNFIPLGQKGTYLNKSYVDIEHSYIDKKLDKAVIIDKYGIRYLVAIELVKDKLELKVKENK